MVEGELKTWRGWECSTEEEAVDEIGDGGIDKVGEEQGVTKEVVNTTVEEREGGGWGGGGGEDQGGGEKASKIGVRPSGTGGDGARGWAHGKP